MSGSPLGRRTALLLELDATVAPPGVAPDPVARVLGRGTAPLPLLLAALERAGGDAQVAGLLVKVGGAGWPLARAQELADALRRFRRRSGAPVVAWAETFGEFAGASVAYYLATGCDEIWLQPSGDLGLTGVAVEATFLAEGLERMGVEPQLGQRHEYKNAADSVLRRSFTDAHREAVTRLARSTAEQLIAGIATARGLPAAEVRALVDRAPLSAAEAKEAGLVDRLGYRDEVYSAVRDRVAGGRGGVPPTLRYLSRYARERPSLPARIRRRGYPVIALVEAHGAIHLGRSRRGPLRGPSTGSDTLSAALRAAVRSEPAALILRVDSPGGSYVASDVIWREVGRVRAAGLPVVASMGDVAGSGGYYVAMGADAIVAQPGTLTGSIGVFGGKAVTAGLLARLGVGHDAVSEGAHARMFTARRGFTPQERELLEEWLDRVYADFTAKVASSRGMSARRVHELARGRVWTGSDAHERGLIDELGGLRRAVEVAAGRAGLDPDRVRLRRFPDVRPLDRLRGPRSSEDRGAAALESGSGIGSGYGIGLGSGYGIGSGFGIGWGYGTGSDWGPLSAVAGALGLPSEGPLMLPYQLRLS